LGTPSFGSIAASNPTGKRNLATVCIEQQDKIITGDDVNAYLF
jgi:hypothetical protein